MSEPTSPAPAYYVHPVYVVGPPAPPRGLSIAALVLGLVGLFLSWFLFGLPSLLAVIFGHVALKREPAGRGMAIGGLVTGYLVLLLGVLGAVGLVVAFLVFGVALWDLGVSGTGTGTGPQPVPA